MNVNVPRYDIFAGRRDTDATWIEAVEGLGSPNARLQQLAAEHPGPYQLFYSHTVRTVYLRALLLVLSVLSNVLICHAAGQQPSAKNVLVLFSGVDTDNQFLDLIEPVIRAGVPGPTTFYDSYLVYDPDEQKRKRSWQSEAETLQSTYAGVKLDLVIAVSSPAIAFAMQYRDKLFPGVPIVISQVDRREIEGHVWPGVTGITIRVGIGETIDLALRLQPDTKAVAIVASPGSPWFAIAHSELLRRVDKVREIDLLEAPSRNLLEKVAALHPHTVVLFQLSPDLGRSDFGTWYVLDGVAQRFPTYSAWTTLCLDHGCIGGAFGSHPKQITSTGEIAARVLSGERPEDIPIVDFPVHATVDWRELRRWHIPDSALPADTEVLYREPSFWRRYKRYAISAFAVIVVQFSLILWLLWLRARKRKAEAVLRESEKRFRVMADTTPALVWMCNENGDIAYLNERRLSFTGAHPHTGYVDTWRAYVHPDDLKNVVDALSGALKSQQPISQQYRLRRQDGVYRWMFDVASPRVNGDGSFAGFIGSAVDVTDQKVAQEALEKISGQLIEAQEKERSRLARELHDDICQRLAMLSLKIEKAGMSSGRGPLPVGSQWEQIWQECSNLTGDVQALSHELHPSILDNLGLATAVKSFCREVSEQNGVVVEFVGKNIPNSLPREISLSLFRVIQEAVHNAIKYSGEKQFEVRLQANDAEVELEVTDRGAGFDAARTSDRRGLGLVSMAERIHQVNGTFKIISEQKRGTRIQVRVPLATHSRVMTTAPN
jgi:PAS domain S-box-containing protein